MNPVRNRMFDVIFNPIYKRIAEVEVVWNWVFPPVSQTFPLDHEPEASMLYRYNPTKKQ